MRSNSNHRRLRCEWLLGLYALMLFDTGGLLRGQEVTPPPERKVLEVHPAAVPDPVLKYRLLPGYGERRAGNAAVFYGKVTAEQSVYFRREYWDQYQQLRELPLAEQLTSPLLDNFGSTPGYSMLRMAALCDDCDWQHPLRDENALEILLPEVQQTRNFARLLELQTLRQIRDRDFEGAVETLQTGHALARNVSKAPLMVNQLVGMAIEGIMREALELLLQQPEAPNLYWALAFAPRPLQNLRDSFEAEADVTLRNVPGFDQLESGIDDPRFWGEQYARAHACLRQFGSGRTDIRDVAGVASAIGYPVAKALLQDSGYPAEKVETLPVGKALLLAERVNFQRNVQLQAAHAALPFSMVPPQAAGKNSGPSPFLTDDLFGGSVRLAELRNERWRCALMVVEGLRHYAARHGGELPDSLDQVTETPLFPDPATGLPFEYRREGNVATVEGPDLPDGDPSFGFEVRMKAGK